MKARDLSIDLGTRQPLQGLPIIRRDDPHRWLRLDAEVDLRSRRLLASIEATERAERDVRRRRFQRFARAVAGSRIVGAFNFFGISTAAAAEAARAFATAYRNPPNEPSEPAGVTR